MKKKPTSYIIWALAVMPLILSIAFWSVVYLTRQPYERATYQYVEVEDEEPIEYQEVDKAVLYIGDRYYTPRFWSNDSCTVEGPFRADTLVIISTDHSIQCDND